MARKDLFKFTYRQTLRLYFNVMFNELQNQFTYTQNL